MNDEQIEKLQKDFDGLSEDEELLAAAKMQAEFLYDSQNALAEFDATPDAEKLYGLKSEIGHALELAKQNLAATLERISEQELVKLRDKEIITVQDFEEALRTKRELELSRGDKSQQIESER